MTVPLEYSDLAKRLSEIRRWAGDLTEGNRCATVIGLTLRVLPGPRDLTFRGQPSAKADVRNHPFMDKMFVKAEEAALQITKRYGPPDISGAGQDVLDKIRDVKGVIYLRDCWRTPTEKVKHFLGMKSSKTGDHIDLWDGQVLEIYRDEPHNNRLVAAAQRALLWKTER